MTKDEKIMAYSMRLDGVPVQNIAEHFGVSRQYIYALMPPHTQKTQHAERYTTYIYPNIVKYMRRNGVTLTTLAENVGMSVASISQFLAGRHNGSKKLIDGILAAMGLTYEVAFAKKTGATRNGTQGEIRT